MIGKPRKNGSYKISFGPGNFLLIILFSILLLEIIFFFPVLKSENDMVLLIQNGTAEEKILAIQILSNRGETWQINGEVLQNLLGSSNSLMKEFAMTPTVTRFLGNQDQIAYLRNLGHLKEKIRCSFFLKFQVGTGIPMRTDDLVSYLENLEKEGISR